MGNKIHHFSSDTDLNIRVSWSINAALQYLNGKDKEWAEVKRTAEKFLDMFDEMRDEINICVVCGGKSSNLNQVSNGLHAKCRQDETFKLH